MNNTHASTVLPPQWDLLHFWITGVCTLVFPSLHPIWWEQELPKSFSSCSMVGGGVQHKQLR